MYTITCTKLTYIKIAWCLYGQPRFLLEGYNTIKNFIKNHNVDFYYHTWTLNDGESYDYIFKEFDFGTVKVTIDDINQRHIRQNHKLSLIIMMILE